jgi:hypothetical protein
MQFEPGRIGVRILIDVIHPLGVQRGCPALYTMNLITLFQQKFREIRSVLTGYTGDKSHFGHCFHYP